MDLSFGESLVNASSATRWRHNHSPPLNRPLEYSAPVDSNAAASLPPYTNRPNAPPCLLLLPRAHSATSSTSRSFVRPISFLVLFQWTLAKDLAVTGLSRRFRLDSQCILLFSRDPSSAIRWDNFIRRYPLPAKQFLYLRPSCSVDSTPPRYIRSRRRVSLYHPPHCSPDYLILSLSLSFSLSVSGPSPIVVSPFTIYAAVILYSLPTIHLCRFPLTPAGCRRRFGICTLLHLRLGSQIPLYEDSYLGALGSASNFRHLPAILLIPLHTLSLISMNYKINLDHPAYRTLMSPPLYGASLKIFQLV
ncbi:hypothetical protein C8R45DRAFT_1100397 [Mycena sanguinolenta]|nr:hypothetical protein C8R45DRAFT_1100397 [Mycena sanguinolenta]